MALTQEQIDTAKAVLAEVAADNAPTKKQIVIGHRSHMWVGDVSIDGDNVVIDNAAAIRRWGTTRGVGELAVRGPLDNTKLDPCPRVTIHKLAVIARIDCEVSSWIP